MGAVAHSGAAWLFASGQDSAGRDSAGYVNPRQAGPDRAGHRGIIRVTPTFRAVAGIDGGNRRPLRWCAQRTLGLHLLCRLSASRVT